MQELLTARFANRQAARKAFENSAPEIGAAAHTDGRVEIPSSVGWIVWRSGIQARTHVAKNLICHEEGLAGRKMLPTAGAFGLCHEPIL